jgi:hypothetical protein
MIYTCVILPVSVVRFIGFHQESQTGHNTIPPSATFTVGILYSLSGVYDAILFIFTRRELFKKHKVMEGEAPTFFEGDKAGSRKSDIAMSTIESDTSAAA